jgi:DNA-binding transcriptional MerR regulator
MTMTVDGLMPIGRFARLVGLSQKALRLYHAQGVLVPAAIDPASGYRLYAAEQIPRAEAIRRLRRMGMALAEVGGVLDAPDAHIRRERLLELRRDLGRRAAETQVAMEVVQRLIDGRETLMPDGSTPIPTLDEAARRRLAADLFNRVWTLLDKPGRTREEDEEMLHAAHASRHHWGEVGTAARRARGEWQCSRVYAVLGRSEPALHHARRCLEICESAPDEMADFDLPFAYEALARAHALAGNSEDARRHLALGERAAASIADEDDRELVRADLASITIPGI